MGLIRGRGQHRVFQGRRFSRQRQVQHNSGQVHRPVQQQSTNHTQATNKPAPANHPAPTNQSKPAPANNAAPPSGGTTKPAPATGTGSANQAAPANQTAAAKPQDNSAQGWGQKLFNGFSNLVGSENLGAIGVAGKQFKFSDNERKTAESGLAALRKMAGKDGVLTPDDRGNIIGQMNGALTQEKNRQVGAIADQKIAQAKANRPRFLQRLAPNAPLVSRIGAKKKAEAMRDPQHMATARNTALGQLNQGMKQMGMDTSAGVNMGQGLRNAQNLPPISMQDTKNFEQTMKMVEAKAKEMGLPEGKFKEGLSVKFLEEVLKGTPAIGLRPHQLHPFGQ
ncbi:MAG: hypothetical protein KC910_04465 [Candidatus Eremiobacteraeota bacterium]|nr:hypothetical protein [Candidatus Eremiobacteraeota bacterium]